MKLTYACFVAPVPKRALYGMIESKVKSTKNLVAIRKFTQALTAEEKIFEAARLALFELHGDRDESGQITVRDAEKQEFLSKGDELIATEFEIPWVPIPVEDFVSAERLSAQDLNFLIEIGAVSE